MDPIEIRNSEADAVDIRYEISAIFIAGDLNEDGLFSLDEFETMLTRQKEGSLDVNDYKFY